MRCPYCGYDKVQPNFNFCPLCKKPLNENATTMKTPHASQSNQDLHEKNAFTRLFDGWTYEKAIADPYSHTTPKRISISFEEINRIQIACYAIKKQNDNLTYLLGYHFSLHLVFVIQLGLEPRSGQKRAFYSKNSFPTRRKHYFY